MQIKVPDSVTAVLRRMLGCCGWDCHCMSWHWRGDYCEECKHVLATREHEKNRDAMRALMVSSQPKLKPPAKIFPFFHPNDFVETIAKRWPHVFRKGD